MIVVVGNACVDVTFRTDRLPVPGETVNALAVSEDLGGKGLNQAVAACRAGADVRLVAPVGDDAAADQIRAFLRDEGIPADDLVASPGRTDRSVILVDRAGENVIVTDAARAEAMALADGAAGLALALGDALVLQGNLPDATTRIAAEAARRAGASVVLNPAPFRPSLVGLAPLVDVLVVNAVEAARWSGVDDIDAALTRLGAPLALVTLGAAGCVLVRAGDAPVRIPSPPADAVDTVGAGDAFVGTFAAEWVRTRDPLRAARLAVAVASFKVVRSGTLSAFPSRAEVERLRDELSGERSP
jgi:ribokinase